MLHCTFLSLNARFLGGATAYKNVALFNFFFAVLLYTLSHSSSPPGTPSCVETLGERHQRCPALNHMCNQSKLTARRQVR